MWKTSLDKGKSAPLLALKVDKAYPHFPNPKSYIRLNEWKVVTPRTQAEREARREEGEARQENRGRNAT